MVGGRGDVEGQPALLSCSHRLHVQQHQLWLSDGKKITPQDNVSDVRRPVSFISHILSVLYLRFIILRGSCGPRTTFSVRDRTAEPLVFILKPPNVSGSKQEDQLFLLFFFAHMRLNHLCILYYWNKGHVRYLS